LKAADFKYTKALSLQEVFNLQAQYGEGAQILAGGQSLIPMMNLRMASPGTLIDITGLAELKGITRSSGRVVIGALTTHAEILNSEIVKEFVPLLAQAAPYVAHLAIRYKGTLGGSLALADPAAEYPAVAVALNATIVLKTQVGERRVQAEDFFQGLYKTALEPGEVLTSVEFEEARACELSSFSELARRKGDYALVGVAVHLTLEGSMISSARLAFMAVEDKPVLALQAMRTLCGQPLNSFTPKLSADTHHALLEDISPWGDLQATGDTKSHLAGVILGRALFEMAAQNV
jgi:carbon-monoxide dehydrogenase medium subunit